MFYHFSSFATRISRLCAICLLTGAFLWLAVRPLQAQDADSSGLKTVVVQGVGAGEDQAKARDEAIVNAQRKAVEQGVGLYLKSETIVVNLQLLQDTIYRNVVGYVHTYRILQEGYNARKDLYRVTIDAKVRAGQISDDLVVSLSAPANRRQSAHPAGHRADHGRYPRRVRAECDHRATGGFGLQGAGRCATATGARKSGAEDAARWAR